MKQVWISTLLALLLIAVLGFTVYSKPSVLNPVTQVQVMQKDITQQIPIDVTLALSTATGVQTVTVPLNLNLNLTVGPIDAINLAVDVHQAQPLESPLMGESSADATESITTTEAVTTTGE